MDQDKGEEVLKMLADDLLELGSLTEPLSEETFNCLASEVGNKTMETGEDFFTDRLDRGNIGSRFMDIEECDTKTFINENKNKNTHYKTRSDMKLFYEWTMSIGENRPVESIPVSELDALLARFYLAARKRDGSEYEPDTISAIQNSIDRHLKDQNVKFSIKRDAEFSHSDRVLESKRKNLKSQGKGNKKLRADPLSTDEIEMLHEKDLLGSATPESLLHTVWINNGVYFGLRGRQDHTNLMLGDIELKATTSGRSYLEFNERSTKTRSGQKGAYRKVSPKLFATDDETCAVKMYRLYASHRPSDLLEPDSRFYLQPLKNPSGKVWYSHQPVGKSKLGQIMNILAEKGNLQGRKVNHSTRKTFASTLIQAGRPPTEVVHLAGWKNIQTVNEYSVPSIQQQAEASDIISNVMQKKAAVDLTTPPVSDNKENCDKLQVNSYNNEMSYSNKQSTNPYAFMSGATISGGTFNINIYSGKKKHYSDSSQEQIE